MELAVVYLLAPTHYTTTNQQINSLVTGSGRTAVPQQLATTKQSRRVYCIAIQRLRLGPYFDRDELSCYVAESEQRQHGVPIY